MPKLYANGLTVLHVGDKPIEADKKGMIEVPTEHVEAALVHGCTHEPKKAGAAKADGAKEDAVARLAGAVAVIEEKLAQIEARLSALETGAKAG